MAYNWYTSGLGGTALNDYLYGGESATSSGSTASSTDTASAGDYQKNALSDNLALSSSLTDLSELINEINRNAQTYANYSRIPNEVNLEEASSSNIADALAGKLSQGTIDTAMQNAGEYGAMIGSPTSANVNLQLMKLLGTDSEKQQALGQQYLSEATSRNPSAKTYDASQMLLTPAQEAEIALKLQELALQEKQINKVQTPNVPSWSGGSSGSKVGGSNNLSSLFPSSDGTSSGSNGTATTSWYDPDTWYDWEEEMWSSPSEYYDIGGLTDTGGVDFLDWAWGDY